MVLECEQILMNKEVLTAVFILKWICFSELSILRISICGEVKRLLIRKLSGAFCQIALIIF